MRASLLEAMQALRRALAVEHQLPEPSTLEEALLPPLSHCWGETLPILRGFLGNATQPWQGVVEALAKPGNS